MRLNLRLFLKELLLFSSALFLAIFSASRLLASDMTVILPSKFDLKDIIVFVVLIAVLILAKNKKKFLHGFYRTSLILVIFLGSQLVFSAFFISPFDLILAVSLLVVFFIYKNVLMHNLAILLGITGIGIMLGMSIVPKTAVIFLVILSFYDIISVYKTKHMVSLAKDMIESGAIFGFIVPPRFGDFLATKQKAHSQIGSQFMVLGSGDIGLPLIMVCSLVSISLVASVITAVFSIFGLLLTHLIFINQIERKPMAALPPIATLTIIGYLITSL